jgi:outer membrane protein assembly factor BamB
MVIDRETGRVRWRRNDLDWLPKVRRTVYHGGLVAFEVSTLNDDGPENALHLLSAATGEVKLDHPFLPGMNHRRQARAMFVNGNLWLLHGGKDAEKKKLPVQVSAIDMTTGEALVTHPAGLAHCFPPVVTSRYMISGEFDLTDLSTGEVDAHQITKAACGPDGGWVPANGLIYVTPKHCVCWPMLRGYTALASERPAGSIAEMDVEKMEFSLETGVEPPADPPAEDDSQDWPMYRHDAWRSGSTTAEAPSEFNTIWSVDLNPKVPSGIITHDWEENCFVKGPITSPVIAGDRVIVARPDAHEVVALDAGSGKIAWRFTACGRVDTTPTLHKGLCLFGSKAGWVYCLRADDGGLVWRLRAAPVEEQIVAYGQLESPWPVPGSVLVIDDVAYFAAGRQSLADGGILIFAVEPATGTIGWTRRLDTVPQQGFYECSGLEFDNFDLLHREGEGVGMSRWVFDRVSGEMSLDRWAAFARLDTGGGAVMAPRGCWTYAPRHQSRIKSYEPLRPLTVYRDKVLFGSLQGSSTVYRRDFDLEGGEEFETKWMTGWHAGSLSRQGEMPWRSHRLAEKAAWKADPLGSGKDAPPIHAMTLAGNRLLLAGGNGDLCAVSVDDGSVLSEEKLPEPLWDGMAVAQGRLFYSTQGGKLMCLGNKGGD